MESDHEARSCRLYLGLIIVLLLVYGALKAWHVSVALRAFDGQELQVDTRGAAH